MAVGRVKRETKSQQRPPKSDTSDRKTRISSACQACKKRKTRCSGLPSPCTACQYVGAHCHFNLRLDTRRKNSYSLLAVQEHQRAILDGLLQVLKHSDIQCIETLLQLIRNDNHPEEIVTSLMHSFSDLQVKGILPQLKFDEYDLMALGLQSLSNEPVNRRAPSPVKIHLQTLDGRNGAAAPSPDSAPSTGAEQHLHAHSHPFTPPDGFPHAGFGLAPHFCSTTDEAIMNDTAVEPSTQDAQLPIYSISPASMSPPARIVNGETRGVSQVVDPRRTSSAIALHSSYQAARGLSVNGSGSGNPPVPRLNTDQGPPEPSRHMSLRGGLTPVSPRASELRTKSMPMQESMSEGNLRDHHPPPSSFMDDEFTDATQQSRSNSHLSGLQAAPAPYFPPHLPIHSGYLLPSNGSAESYLDLHPYHHAYQNQLLSPRFTSVYNLHGAQSNHLVRAPWDPTFCPAGFPQTLDM